MRGIFYGYLFWSNEIVKDPFATVIHFKIFYLTAIFNVSFKAEIHIGSCMVKIVKKNKKVLNHTVESFIDKEVFSWKTTLNFGPIALKF